MLKRIEFGKIGRKIREVSFPGISGLQLNPSSLIFLINSWIFMYLGLQITKLYGIASTRSETITAVYPSLASYLDLAQIAGPLLVLYAMVQIAAAVVEVMRG